MFEMIKKSIFAGIGAAIVTKEKIEEATRLLVKEGKISTEEAEKLAEELVKSGERQCEEFTAGISDTMRKCSENMDLLRRKEFLEFVARVESLEQRLSALEAAQKKE